ncbi:adenylate/guanylate cyclase domain-containing protein [Ramlibacter sp. PS3R-8]|uniref:adenylate/guanylate cyclase domain-containing protein n=1 Tax=Ramlibacter sp. PS3R-8 TaxID=3133437 RepID=UPI0030B4EEE3
MARLDKSTFSRIGTVIAMADVVESVRLMEEDTPSFIERWQGFVAFVAQQLPEHGGRMRRSLGDGLMLEFADAAGCMRALLAMQAWLHERNRSMQPHERMHLRIGAHLADLVEDQYDIYGPDVNLSSRIAALAGPNEIIISAALREQLQQWAGATIDDLGICHLKHVRDPVHAFRVGPPGAASVIPAQALAAPPSLRARIAITPFASEGEAVPGSNGESLADEIVAALARSDVLHVMSRMSPVAPVDATASGQQQPGPAYVLGGRTRAAAGSVTLYLELTESLHGHVTWAETFARALRDPSSMHPHLLAHVVAAVHGAVIHQEVEASRNRPLPSLEGGTLLLASLGLMHRLAPVDMDQARAMLEHLVDRWRRQSIAHAWLSHLHVLRVQQASAGFTAHEGAVARAQSAAGVQGDPGSALVLALDGHASLHTALNKEAAADRYAQALRLRGDHSLALLFQAELLALLECGPQARAIAERALGTLSLEPLRYLYEAICAMVMLADGDSEAAHGLAQQSVQRNPRYLPAWRTLVVAQVETDRLGEAHAALQRLMTKQPAFAVNAFLQASPFDGELAGRYSEALLHAGAPAE